MRLCPINPSGTAQKKDFGLASLEIQIAAFFLCNIGQIFSEFPKGKALGGMLYFLIDL